jgi:hypothetical protein
VEGHVQVSFEFLGCIISTGRGNFLCLRAGFGSSALYSYPPKVVDSSFLASGAGTNKADVTSEDYGAGREA